MSTWSAYVVALLFIWNLFSFTTGQPVLDLSAGNTIVPEDGSISITGTTSWCRPSYPSFTWDLVSTNGSFPPIRLHGSMVRTTHDGPCTAISALFTASLHVGYWVNPVVYGQAVFVHLTLNNELRDSVTSTGTLSFPVSYSLTGSSERASLGEQFTWTCHMTVPPTETQAFIKFYRNETTVATIGYTNQCETSSANLRYIYSCSTQREFNLIIPAHSLTEEEQNSIWRCAYFSGHSSYSSIQKQLVIAIDGGWSKWTEFSQCSRTCGQGVQMKARTCTNPSPSYGGKECFGQANDTRSCQLRACPVNGNWGHWGNFRPCDTSCGSGLHFRLRRCNDPPPSHGGLPCPGQAIQAQACNTQACPDRMQSTPSSNVIGR